MYESWDSILIYTGEDRFVQSKTVICQSKGKSKISFHLKIKLPVERMKEKKGNLELSV